MQVRSTYLLVGKDEEKGVTELVLTQHALDWMSAGKPIPTHAPRAPR